MKLLSYLRTSKQLGWRNCAVVGGHRLALRAGLYERQLPLVPCPTPEQINGEHQPAPIFSEHNDWWVLNEEGDPITYSNLGSGEYAIIDVTHPDAGPWMRDQVARQKQNGCCGVP